MRNAHLDPFSLPYSGSGLDWQASSKFGRQKFNGNLAVIFGAAYHSALAGKDQSKIFGNLGP